MEMNVTMKITDIMDTIQEIIIFKAGVYLQAEEIRDVLKRINTDLANVLLETEDDSYHRFKPEEIEHVINEIRVSIGELSDSDPLPLFNLMKRFPEHQAEIASVVNVMQQCMDWHINEYGLEVPLGENFVVCLMNKSSASRKICDLVFYAIVQTLNRSISYRQSIKNWDGVVKLSDLFESEILPDSTEIYFDQRFIDYLSNNTHSLYGMNWRQFEGLTAEFFKRNGFQVKLGGGRKDGGIDIYALDSETGQMLIIQLKRYAQGKSVDVNSIKALYFDVVDKNADHALLATTSIICPEGKKISARNYPISLAEHNNIVHWVKSMESKVKF